MAVGSAGPVTFSVGTHSRERSTLEEALALLRFGLTTGEEGEAPESICGETVELYSAPYWSPWLLALESRPCLCCIRCWCSFCLAACSWKERYAAASVCFCSSVLRTVEQWLRLFSSSRKWRSFCLRLALRTPTKAPF